MSRILQDLALAALLALGVLLVHDVGYVLHHPYWLDEAWVADSTRVPLSRVLGVTSVTPVGFSLLLRAAVVGGDQKHRLIPLAFAGATVSESQMAVRRLPRPSTPSWLWSLRRLWQVASRSHSLPPSAPTAPCVGTESVSSPCRRTSWGRSCRVSTYSAREGRKATLVGNQGAEE